MNPPVTVRPSYDRADWEPAVDLCDLQRVAVTATVDAQGNLGKIEGLWDKLGAAANLAQRGLLRVVVVSDLQDDVPEANLGTDGPFRVIKAGNIDDAIAKVRASLGPRGAVMRAERDRSRDVRVLTRSFPIDKIYQLPSLRAAVGAWGTTAATGNRRPDPDHARRDFLETFAGRPRQDVAVDLPTITPEEIL